jgi:hypothetical protein
VFGDDEYQRIPLSGLKLRSKYAAIGTMNPPPDQITCDRRQLLFHSGVGLGSIALSWMLQQDAIAKPVSVHPANPLAARASHFPARAQSIIFLMMEGGPSQIDTFDPKPELKRVDGQLFKRTSVRTAQVRGNRYFVRSPFKFRKYGQCGMEVSELFEQTAAHVDDIAVLRSGYGDSDNHPAAVFQYTTGFPVQGNPSIGSWVVYGLGSENENLPSFVVLRDGKPFGGTTSWGNGFLPALYQGMQFRGGRQPVLNLAAPESVSRGQQETTLKLINTLNEGHRKDRAAFSELPARIAAYELAFRMQRDIPEAIDVERETPSTHKLYGLDEDTSKQFGTRCLLARRLVERGVRFVQVWAHGWDSHDNILEGHRHAAKRVDRPIAGLLADLKQRGLLEETLVVWGGEFGRTADTTESAFNKKKPGRDHNPKATLMWFAGGGVRGGTVVGATDPFGDRAVESRHHLRDVHATLLYLMGLDQETLTYYHGGRLKRLTENGGQLISGLIA